MSNVIAFPVSKAKADELVDIEGRADLRRQLAVVAGMLTRPCTYEDLVAIDTMITAIQLEVACMRLMSCL